MSDHDYVRSLAADLATARAGETNARRFLERADAKVAELEQQVTNLQARVQEEVDHCNRVLRTQGRLQVMNEALADKIQIVQDRCDAARRGYQELNQLHSTLRERCNVAEAKLAGTYEPAMVRLAEVWDEAEAAVREALDDPRGTGWVANPYKKEN